MIEPLYKDCPRCHNSWIDNHHTYEINLYCKNCELNYYFSFRPNYYHFMRFKINDELYLQWNFLQNACYVFTKKLDNNIKLPMLPYNITAEKLKLYMLFS
jgi:hypothetical protein